MLLGLLLSACSSDKVEIGGSPVVYVPPSAPTQDAVITGLKAAASEAKLTEYRRCAPQITVRGAFSLV